MQSRLLYPMVYFVMYLYSNKLKDKLIYNEINKPIPSELCCILLLPESGKHLIDEKYNEFIAKIKKLIDIHDISYRINIKDSLKISIIQFDNKHRFFHTFLILFL
jgi:hypothetical protein